MSRVLVTAGGSGIGAAMAKGFADAGHDVWITDIDAEAVSNSAFKSSLVDASDETAVSTVFNEIQSSWDGLDVLCANAGIAGPTNLVEDVDLVAWRQCVSVNLEGAV